MSATSVKTLNKIEKKKYRNINKKQTLKKQKIYREKNKQEMTKINLTATRNIHSGSMCVQN